MSQPTTSSPVGQQMHDLIARLFPVCRSQTGRGVRESFEILKSVLPIEVSEVPSGTKVFDWEVPDEWNITDAWIKDEHGTRVVDFRESNLHVVNGSQSVAARLSWDELKPHLHTLPEQPDVIPYRAAFAGDRWGFCLSQHQFDRLEAAGDTTWDVCIDSSRIEGSLSMAELLIPGETRDEVLIATHTCHPSLANDGLSGIAVSAFLGRWLQSAPRRYSYRLLFAPATIGAITWLAAHRAHTRQIRHGLVLSCLGDSGRVHYRRSRQGEAEIDQAVAGVLRDRQQGFQLLDFEPSGYDQRQFCSPGFDLPVGGLMRTPNGWFDEYHTSADDLSFVRPEALADSLAVLQATVARLEADFSHRFLNLNPLCEPRLGKAGLYHAFGTRPDSQQLQQAILWVLNGSDGRASLRDIALRSRMPQPQLLEAAELLEKHGFVERLSASTSPGLGAATFASSYRERTSTEISETTP